MKKNLIILAGMAVLISAVSCSIEENKIDPIPADPRVPMTFTAGEFTKTSLVPGENENTVLWSAGDAISIFDGTNNNEFTLTEGAGTASAKFEGEAVPDQTYYALYPYSASAEFSGTAITSTLPAEQQYVGATFDTMLNPSVAVADGNNNLAFHNVASILQINVSKLQGKYVREIQISADKSLTGEYTVAMSNPESYAAVAASGTEISGVRLLVDSADMETDPNFNGSISCYAVVLPGTYTNLKISVIYSDNSYSEKSYQGVTLVASDGNYVNVDASQATTNEQGLYGLYQAGVDIEIGGKLYNKSEYGDATLITTDAEIVASNGTPSHSGLTQINPSKNDGIYFIEPGITVYMNYAGAMSRFFLIGNDIETRSTVVPEVFFRTNVGNVENGELLIYNVDIDYSSASFSSGYLITQNNDAAGIVRIIDSRVSLSTKPLIYLSTSKEGVARYYNEIDLQGNIFKLSGTANFINQGSNAPTMPSIIFKNNIFYAAEVINNYVLYAGTSSTIGKIVLENNTFVNINNGTAALFRYGALNEVELRNNLVYLDTQASGVCFFRPGTATPIDPTPIDPDNTDGPVTNPVYKENPQKGFCEASIFYSDEFTTESAPNKQWFYSGMNRVELETEIEFRVPEENPFANLIISSEIFEPTAEYASYGAQR